MRNCLLIFILTYLLTGIFNKSYSQILAIDSITFDKDYFPGFNDINGKYLGSTETMSIVNHNGKLFAGMGNWMDYPITTESEGTQILRKDSHDSPWVVDTTIGFSSLRCDGFQEVIFTKDYNGDDLSSPVNMLVGGFTRTIPPYNTSIWVRKNDINKWYRNIVNVYSATPGLTGIRSFNIHTDKITGKQWIFCGTASGVIFKAAYDPTKEGLLEIDITPEINNLGRIMAMTVCNNDLYISAGVDVINNDTIGGIYRRIDGVNPSWELVYRWAHDPSINQGQNVMRGLTCIPDPLGSNNDVIIGARNMGGLIQIIQPFNNDNIYTELDVTQYFADLWFDGNWPYMDYAIIAYNDFTPDTINEQKYWWISLAIYAPNQLTSPDNGAYFLLRNEEGMYRWGYIYDDENPVPNGKSLRATRTICKSPFSEESNNTYYFGGYDCLADTSNNTAWIYKGTLHNLTMGTSDFQSQMNQILIYPNPLNNFVTVKNIPKGSTVQIFDVTGKILYQSNDIYSHSLTINTDKYRQGVYLIKVQNSKNTITKKMIVN
ncbi:MAG: T9SS type A sorting domain-containing protein [Brumimicrobium sp.]